MTTPLVRLDGLEEDEVLVQVLAGERGPRYQCVKCGRYHFALLAWLCWECVKENCDAGLPYWEGGR